MPRSTGFRQTNKRFLSSRSGNILSYTLIRSSRRSIGVEIAQDGNVIVRAPRQISVAYIEQFLTAHEPWIRSHQEKIQLKLAHAEENALPLISPAEVRELADRARKEIPLRVSHYAAIIGVTYGRITIRCQTTLWGSCSARGNLNFNCLLMKMPPDILDYVVIHELCHRLEMNHSARFWENVGKFCPDYKTRRKWLKENGDDYIRAMKEGALQK